MIDQDTSAETLGNEISSGSPQELAQPQMIQPCCARSSRTMELSKAKRKHIMAKIFEALDKLQADVDLFRGNLLMVGTTQMWKLAARVVLLASEDQSGGKQAGPLGKLDQDSDKRLSQFSASLPGAPQPTHVASLTNDLISQGESLSCQSDLRKLDMDVAAAVKLLKENSGLRARCQDEALILETYKSFKFEMDLQRPVTGQQQLKHS